MTDAALAQRIWEARRDGDVLPRAVVAGITGAAAAYNLQAAAVEAAGLHRIGWKVAATSDMAVELLKVSGPSIGPVFAERTQASPAEIAIFPAQGPAVECEFAFRLARDLDDGDAPYDRAQLIAAVGAVVPAVEVVASRFEGGFADVGDGLTIADFCFNHAWVHGSDVTDCLGLDLTTAAIRLEKDGTQVADGVGANVLGDPLTALAFAADTAAAIGRPLRAGEIVSTGTCTGVTPVAPGSRIRADFGSLGEIAISFVAG